MRDAVAATDLPREANYYSREFRFKGGNTGNYESVVVEWLIFSLIAISLNQQDSSGIFSLRFWKI